MVNDFPKIELRLALNDKGCENLCNHFLDELEKQHTSKPSTWIEKYRDTSYSNVNSHSNIGKNKWHNGNKT